MRGPLPAILLLCLLALSACAGEERRNGLPDGPILLPTLDLVPIEEPNPDFSALLIGQQAGVNIHSFTSDEATAGFLAPTDQHVLFLAPALLAQGTQVQIVHGSPLLWEDVRYWGYEYSGNETANRDAGRTGRQLFDGRFWLSQGERDVTQALYGYLHTTGPNATQMNMAGSKLYYLMVDGGAGTGGNPGLQGRPFVVCTGERSTCETTLFGASSSAASSAVSSGASSAASSAASVISSAASSVASSAVSSVTSSVVANSSSVQAVSCLFQSLTGVTAPGALAKADLDGDGDEDMVVLSNATANPGYPTFSVLKNNLGTFEKIAEHTSTATAFRGIALGNVNNDSRPDLALSLDGGAGMLVFLNPGDGNFAQVTGNNIITVSGPSGTFEELAIGDLDGDGFTDIISGGSVRGGSVFMGSATLTFTPGPVLGQTGGNQYHPTLIDVNGDTHLDFVATPWGGLTATHLLVYLNDGTGEFNAPQIYANPDSNGNTNVLLFGDINEDGSVDIVQVPNTNGSVLGWINNGAGAFSKTVLGPVGGRDGALADFNGDGHPDVISGNYLLPNYQVLLGNGDGTFTVQTWASTIVGREIIASDFDANGTMDFAQAMGESGDAIRIARNVAACMATTFPPVTSSAASSVATVTCGDGTTGTDEVCDDGKHCSNGTQCTTAAVCTGIGDGQCLARASDDCSADCQCDQWAAAEAFMNTNCASATTHQEKLDCYNGILLLWNGIGTSTPPAMPDIDCSGTGETTDVLLLSPILLRHFPLTQ